MAKRRSRSLSGSIDEHRSKFNLAKQQASGAIGNAYAKLAKNDCAMAFSYISSAAQATGRAKAHGDEVPSLHKKVLTLSRDFDHADDAFNDVCLTRGLSGLRRRSHRRK